MNLLNLFANSSSAAGDAAAAGMMAGGMMMYFIVIIAVYIIQGLALMTIANKLGEENGWWGFVPILNLVLTVKLAQKEMWWVILFFVPCVNIVAVILSWNAIAVRRGKPDYMGWLMLIPCVGWFVPLYIAFSD